MSLSNFQSIINRIEFGLEVRSRSSAHDAQSIMPSGYFFFYHPFLIFQTNFLKKNLKLEMLNFYIIFFYVCNFLKVYQ